MVFFLGLSSLLWIGMGLVGLCRFLCVLMGPYGFFKSFCTLIDFNGFQWVRISYFEFLRVLMGL